MDTPQIPPIFLSHSGDQKDFTWRLYRELGRVNHKPFFDRDSRDSLPKGDPFPSRIVEACHACKLGIVVLSHEYVKSLWPMLELQHLLFGNPSSPNKVYPIFYNLSPADLSNQDNLTRWKKAWKRQEPSWRAKLAVSATPPMLDISLWPRALEELRCQSGEVLLDQKDLHPFIQTIVSNICKRLPPPDSFLMGDHYQGAELIQQNIHRLFQQQQRDEEVDGPLIAVGVYGVGGSGKTTLCKYMLSFYNKERYPGTCWCIQFPSREEDESQLLVQLMKLSARAEESPDKINNISVEQALRELQNFLERYKVFLVLDNIWDWALQIAKQILTMDYVLGSRLLVTARSEGVLRNLSSCRRIRANVEGVARLGEMQIVPVPSISEEEAIKVLMAYSCTSHILASAEDLQPLARSCFFGDQCHPLLLAAVGAKLRGHTRSVQEWTGFMSRLRRNNNINDVAIEDTVVKVLRTSFDALDRELQDTFLKLGTCIPKVFEQYQSLRGSSEWLSRLSHSHTNEQIRDQLVELEYHGLIQIERLVGDKIVIHDLHMKSIDNIVREKDGAPRCFFFEGDVATLSTSDWRRLRYISGYVCRPTDWEVVNLDYCPAVEVFELRGDTETGNIHTRFSVEHMQSLRYLELIDMGSLEEVGGWQGAPNLVSVKLWFRRNLGKIESMACLRRLECLELGNGWCIKEPHWSMACLSRLLECLELGNGWCTAAGQEPHWSGSRENLKRLVIQKNDVLINHGSVGHLPKLRELHISGRDTTMARNRVDVQGTLAAFTSLERFILEDSDDICRLRLDFKYSINLRVLKLSRCRMLQSIEGSLCGLTALEKLDLRAGCSNLESIADLKALVKLKTLRVDGCRALREVNVGEAALTRLESLGVPLGCSIFCMSYSPLPLQISAFTNLRKLRWVGHKAAGGANITILNLQGIALPLSLQSLKFADFKSLEEIEGLGSNTRHVRTDKETPLCTLVPSKLMSWYSQLMFKLLLANASH